MLIIVIAKPIQFTIVKAVPFIFKSAFVATKVENSGESAMTTKPQINRKIKKKTSLRFSIKKGVNTQQIPESNNMAKATFLGGFFREISPLNTQPKKPIAITKKEYKETFISV